MIGRRLLSLSFAACLACVSGVALAFDRATEAICRFFSDAFAAIAGRQPMFAGFGSDGAMLGRPPLYDAPQQHALRHEAGVARRAAHRNI